MSELSMLEQIARRFETYADDQNAMVRRFGAKGAENAARVVRANTYLSVAKELRKIGDDNFKSFVTEVREHIYCEDEGSASINDVMAEAITALFVTKPEDKS